MPIYSVDELVDTLDRAQHEHDTGGFLAAFEAIAPALENGVRDPRLIYLTILSLARCGASRLAWTTIADSVGSSPQPRTIARWAPG